MYQPLPITGFTGIVYGVIGLCLSIVAGLGLLASRLLRAH